MPLLRPVRWTTSRSLSTSPADSNALRISDAWTSALMMYRSCEGRGIGKFVPQTITQGAAVIRKAFRMSLHPGHQAEYMRRHNPIWTELDEVLRRHGVHHYSIFLDPDT